VTDHIKVLREIPRIEWFKCSNGKIKFDKRGNIVYLENSSGFWAKIKFDKNNNIIYKECSDGFWEKTKFDKNNNIIYQENSYGYWEKRQFDKNSNEIYFVDSIGRWKKIKYDENNNKVYLEDSHGYSTIRKFDDNNNEIYYECSNGFWKKMKYDQNNKRIYLEDSYGAYYKCEFDKNNKIYFEDYNGFWEKLKYDENNNEIYRENSVGFLVKRKFDKNNNLIYYEDSDGNIEEIQISYTGTQFRVCPEGSPGPTVDRNKKGFLICPVRNVDDTTKNIIEEYLKKLENGEYDGKKWDIHYPTRDTNQEDDTGYSICEQNMNAISESDRVFFIWDGKSQGCLFDLGMAFSLKRPLTCLYIPEIDEKKSFQKMAKYWEGRS
jgi:hypothetical protein